MIQLRLFYEFLKIGLFAVGGGMAALPFIQDMAERTGWCTSAQIADMLAVSESTPGPIGINMATYVGFEVGGITGALAATLGVVIPGVILVILVMVIIGKFRGNKLVEGAFYGLRPASTALIAAAGVLVCEITFLNLDLYAETENIANLLNFKAFVLAAVLLVLTRAVKPTKNLHPVIFIAFSAVVGIAFSFAGV